MNDVITAQLDSLEAQIALLGVQVKALRHALQPAPKVSVMLPERCTSVAAELCGLQSDDAKVTRGSFANPHAWRCNGCGHASLEATG